MFNIFKNRPHFSGIHAFLRIDHTSDQILTIDHTSARNSPKVDPAEIFRKPQIPLILVVTAVKLFMAK